MRYCAVVAYDGSAYQGFQRLAHDLPSVQGAIEQALKAVLGSVVQLRGAARTDTGVHASGQVITFNADWSHDEASLMRAINATLPADIAIRRLSTASIIFHPRFDAYSRTYRYQVCEATPRHPLYDRRTWQIRSPLDLDAMQQTASTLIGEHDFGGFGTPTQGESTTRTIYRSEWVAAELYEDVDGLSGRLLSYWVEASGFLKHMVRMLAGGMINVGLGKNTVAEFVTRLQAANRSRAKATAPPHALTLMGVTYLSTAVTPDAVRTITPAMA